MKKVYRKVSTVERVYIGFLFFSPLFAGSIYDAAGNEWSFEIRRKRIKFCSLYHSYLKNIP